MRSAVLVLAVCVSVALCANEISLLEVNKFPCLCWNNNTGVNCTNTMWKIVVKNLSYQKIVQVVGVTAAGEVPVDATFKYTSGSNLETWFAYFSPEYPATAPFDKFYLKYTVNGKTYYDNNAGKNFPLVNDGPALYNSYKVVVESAVMESTVYDYWVEVRTVVQNLGFTKAVTLFYTWDNWYSTQKTAMTYDGKYCSCGEDKCVAEPDKDNCETWQGGFDAVSPSGYQVYVEYDVDGQKYTDNNFGINYTPTWY
eukprot:TRINITY_DN9038_c0_g1_i1.p2 TRINITY_DN9038_c0_g1~~TRINITY_DN9038_c0_g1_i1.p2  ORF type:complete len:254 (-),score=81.12 TRINITY_DN9038_c0_g1_i1:141-902(-)